MRSTVLAAIGCLILGALGALGYSHYLGEGKQLADLQAQLSDSQAALAKAKQDGIDSKKETDAMSAQAASLPAQDSLSWCGPKYRLHFM